MGKLSKKVIGHTIKHLNNLYEDGFNYNNFKKRRELKKRSINYQRYKLFRKKWLFDCKISTVIDIGANVGEFTCIFNELFPNAEIHAFEPILDCFSKLDKRTKSYENIKTYNLGLGNEDGELELHKSSWHPASSFREMGGLHKINYPHSANSVDMKVKIKKLDDILHDEPLVDNIFIKMDVQGFEDEVIKGGKNVFNKAKVIVVESSFQKLYEGEPLFHGIYSLLKPLGFDFVGSLKQSINKEDESFLQGDCIFVKL